MIRFLKDLRFNPCFLGFRQNDFEYIYETLTRISTLVFLDLDFELGESEWNSKYGFQPLFSWIQTRIKTNWAENLHNWWCFNPCFLGSELSGLLATYVIKFTFQSLFSWIWTRNFQNSEADRERFQSLFSWIWTWLLYPPHPEEKGFQSLFSWIWTGYLMRNRTLQTLFQSLFSWIWTYAVW